MILRKTSQKFLQFLNYYWRTLDKIFTSVNFLLKCRSSKATDIIKRIVGNVVPVLSGETLTVRILVCQQFFRSQLYSFYLLRRNYIIVTGLQRLYYGKEIITIAFFLLKSEKPKIIYITGYRFKTEYLVKFIWLSLIVASEHILWYAPQFLISQAETLNLQLNQECNNPQKYNLPWPMNKHTCLCNSKQWELVLMIFPFPTVLCTITGGLKSI